MKAIIIIAALPWWLKLSFGGLIPIVEKILGGI